MSRLSLRKKRIVWTEFVSHTWRKWSSGVTMRDVRNQARRARFASRMAQRWSNAALRDASIKHERVDFVALMAHWEKDAALSYVPMERWKEESVSHMEQDGIINLQYQMHNGSLFSQTVSLFLRNKTPRYQVAHYLPLLIALCLPNMLPNAKDV